jgi:hypothetical protein
MSTRNLPGGKEWQERKADNFAAIYEMIASKMWDPRCVTTPWVSMACYRDSFTLIQFSSAGFAWRDKEDCAVSGQGAE